MHQIQLPRILIVLIEKDIKIKLAILHQLLIHFLSLRGDGDNSCRQFF